MLKTTKKGMRAVRSLRVGNLHHIGMREEQQDAFAVSSLDCEALVARRGVLAVIADGMGGLEAGADLSAAAVAACMEHFACAEEENPLDALAGIANARVLSHMRENGIRQGGTTLAAAWIYGEYLSFISVGDSRVCLCRGGSLIWLNRAHTVGALLDARAAAGVIPPEGTRSPHRHALTSYLGMNPLEAVDRTEEPIRLLAGDIVLLMTDGVFGTLSEEELRGLLGGDPYRAADLIQSAILLKNRPDQDNFTAIIIACE